MTQSQYANAISGSLYGLFIGDALGCPVENWAPDKIKKVYGRLNEMVEPQSWWRPKGLHSDDGQQAIALLDAILEAPDDPAPGFARILVELLDSGRKGNGFFGLHRGTGSNFRKTVKALAEGDPNAAIRSAGNGNAMMIAPVAWMWSEDLEHMAKMLVDICLVKQTDERGVAAAGAVAYLVAYGIHHNNWHGLDSDVYLAFVRDIEDRVHQRTANTPNRRAFSNALAAMFGDLELSTTALLDRITHRANQTAGRPVKSASGYALASVITSIAIALRATSFEDGVVEIINIGGDTDTTGAMVGAILGAQHGMTSIPDRWVNALIARGAFDDRVDALTSRAWPFTPEVSLRQLERPWTALMDNAL